MKVRLTIEDQLFSKLVKGRANGRCERCGRSDIKLECSHRWTREITALRWAPENADCLCFNCHRWWHKNPAEAYPWLVGKIGREQYDVLFNRAHNETLHLDRAQRRFIQRKLQSAWNGMQRQQAQSFDGRIEFASPYPTPQDTIEPIARKPMARKAKPATGRKIRSAGFDKTRSVKLRTHEVVARHGAARMG
jgi:hypothetical protein